MNTYISKDNLKKTESKNFYTDAFPFIIKANI